MAGALTDAVWIFAAVLVLIILAAAVLASRRYLLERSGGTVECGLRCPVGTGAWRLGVLSYQHDSLSWHGALGVLLRPGYVFHRRALSVVSRRPAEPAEAVALGADRIVVEVSAEPAPDASRLVPGENVELAMTEQALTGFLAWLEASPPGSHLGEISLAFKDRCQLRVAGGGEASGEGAAGVGPGTVDSPATLVAISPLVVVAYCRPLLEGPPCDFRPPIGGLKSHGEEAGSAYRGSAGQLGRAERCTGAPPPSSVTLASTGTP